MRASPRIRSGRLNLGNTPISLSLTAIRRRLTCNRWRERRFWRPGWPAKRCSAALLECLSAVNEHLLSQHLRQLFRRFSRLVPKIVRHSGPTPALKEPGDRGIAVGPISGEYLDPSLPECVAYLGPIDRRGFIDLAGQAPVGGEINENGAALVRVARDSDLAPRLGTGDGVR